MHRFNNRNDTICPLCKTGNTTEAILIAVDGTAEGFRTEAIQFHISCLEGSLIYYPSTGLIASATIPKAN